MAGAGDIYYHALSGFGENIGKGLAENIQRHRKEQQLTMYDLSRLDELEQMKDPTDPKGEKPLVSPQKILHLRQLKGSQLDAAMKGEMDMLKLGETMYKAAAPIRKQIENDKALEQGPITQKDESGRVWRFSGKQWVPVAGGNQDAAEQKKVTAQQKALDSRLKQYNLNRRLLFDSSQHEGGTIKKTDPKGENKPASKEFIPEGDYDKATHLRVGFRSSTDTDKGNPGVIVSKPDIESLQDLAAKTTDDPEWTQGALKWIRENQKDPRAAKWYEVVKRKIMGSAPAETEQAAPDDTSTESD
jgi:hypothetical protein